jgi:hypothetical protein
MLRFFNSFHLWFVLALCIASFSTVANCASPGTKIDFELTGTVLDAVTKEPIEGAYVVASYRVPIVGIAAMTNWCVKTRGMYTGKDGRYHFPVEKLDGLSPAITSAIKPGYFRGRSVFPEKDIWKKQDAQAYSGRDLLLNPQDPGKPDYRYGSGDEFCDHASTRGDAAAGVEFTKIQMSDMIRFRSSASQIDAVRYMIERMENLPASADSGKKRSREYDVSDPN